MKNLFTTALFVGLASFAMGQLSTPAASPSSKVEQTVGLTKINLDYSRPGAKGRQIFGDLVPFGQIWRTGANGSTDISFDKDVTFNGKELKAGSYALYTVPSENLWEVIFHKNTDYWGVGGDSYDKEAEALRFTVASHKNTEFVETFTIDVNNIKNNEANLVLKWADVIVPIPFEVGTRSQVQSDIDKMMAGPSANDYYAAGNFYFQEEIDAEKALEWVSKATELRPEAFWMIRTKSQILASMGKYKDAIATAKVSMKAAEAAGNAQYVSFNEDAIKEWKKLK